MSTKPPQEPQPKIDALIVAQLAEDNDDFAFEMKIGRLLRSYNNIRVTSGRTYRDKQTDKDRAYDFQCTLTNGPRIFNVAVECKNIDLNSPITVCGHTRIPNESFHDVVFAAIGMLLSQEPKGPLLDGNIRKILRCGPGCDLYPLQDPSRNFVGKSVFRPTCINQNGRWVWTPGKDKDDYQVWNQAVNSAADMAVRFAALRPFPESGGFRYHFSVTLPTMVVPDGALWKVTYDDDGKLDSLHLPVQVNEVDLFIDQKARVPRFIGAGNDVISLSHVHIVTQTGLKQMIDLMSSQTSLIWESAFPAARINELIAQFRG